jgi:hypothetical protein
MVPPDPSISLLNFNKTVLAERKVIDESGGKKIKNPSEDIELCAAHQRSIMMQHFEFQHDPQDVGLT